MLHFCQCRNSFRISLLLNRKPKEEKREESDFCFLPATVRALYFQSSSHPWLFLLLTIQSNARSAESTTAISFYTFTYFSIFVAIILNYTPPIFCLGNCHMMSTSFFLRHSLQPFAHLWQFSHSNIITHQPGIQVLRLLAPILYLQTTSLYAQVCGADLAAQQSSGMSMFFSAIRTLIHAIFLPMPKSYLVWKVQISSALQNPEPHS